MPSNEYKPEFASKAHEQLFHMLMDRPIFMITEDTNDYNDPEDYNDMRRL